MCPRVLAAGSWKQNVKNNSALIKRLKNIHFDNLFPFTGKSSIVQKLGNELGLNIRSAPLDKAYWAEDKKSLIDLAHLSNVPFAYKCNNNEELFSHYEKLASRKGYPGKAVIKASQAASGWPRAAQPPRRTLILELPCWMAITTSICPTTV